MLISLKVSLKFLLLNLTLTPYRAGIGQEAATRQAYDGGMIGEAQCGSEQNRSWPGNGQKRYRRPDNSCDRVIHLI